MLSIFYNSYFNSILKECLHAFFFRLFRQGDALPTSVSTDNPANVSRFAARIRSISLEIHGDVVDHGVVREKFGQVVATITDEFVPAGCKDNCASEKVASNNIDAAQNCDNDSKVRSVRAISENDSGSSATNENVNENDEKKRSFRESIAAESFVDPRLLYQIVYITLSIS